MKCRLYFRYAESETAITNTFSQPPQYISIIIFDNLFMMLEVIRGAEVSRASTPTAVC